MGIDSLAVLEAVASKGYRSHNRLYGLAQAGGSGHLSPTARAYQVTLNLFWRSQHSGQECELLNQTDVVMSAGTASASRVTLNESLNTSKPTKPQHECQT